MRLLHKLIPDFLRAWDEDLQRTHPRLWSTRFHMHLWFLLLIVLVVFLLGLLLSVDIRQFPHPEALFAYMMVPAIFYFAFWTYKVVLFSANKRFAPRPAGSEIGEFLVLFGSVFLIWAIPYTLSCTITWRAAHTVDDGTLVEHIDHLNLNAHAFILPQGYYGDHDAYEHSYYNRSASHAFYRSLQEYKQRKHQQHDDEPRLQSLYNGWSRSYNELSDRDNAKYDPDAAAMYKARMDSVERNFHFYFQAHGRYRPPYVRLPFLPDSLLELHYIDHVINERELDHAAIDEALRIAYSYDVRVFPKSAVEVEKDLASRKTTNTKIHLVSEQIKNIAQAKDWNYFFTRWEMFLPTMIIVAFVLSLLVSIFKSIYWQPYLIAFVSSLVVPILVMILGLIVSRKVFSADEFDFFIYGNYLLLVAMIIATPFVMKLPAYRTFKAVTTILANLAVPFIALYTLHLLHTDMDIFGLKALQYRYAGGAWEALPEYIQIAHSEEETRLRNVIDLWYFATLWLGIAIYIVLFHRMFRSVFARLMALPERK